MLGFSLSYALFSHLYHCFFFLSFYSVSHLSCSLCAPYPCFSGSLSRSRSLASTPPNYTAWSQSSGTELFFIAVESTPCSPVATTVHSPLHLSWTTPFLIIRKRRKTRPWPKCWPALAQSRFLLLRRLKSLPSLLRPPLPNQSQCVARMGDRLQKKKGKWRQKHIQSAKEPISIRKRKPFLAKDAM